MAKLEAYDKAPVSYTHLDVYKRQVHPPGNLPADCGAVWLYRQRDDRDFDFGRLADDGFLLCDGQKHGAQGRADQQCGHVGDGAFLRVADAVDFSAAAVRAAVSG